MDVSLILKLLSNNALSAGWSDTVPIQITIFWCEFVTCGQVIVAPASILWHGNQCHKDIQWAEKMVHFQVKITNIFLVAPNPLLLLFSRSGHGFCSSKFSEVVWRTHKFRFAFWMLWKWFLSDCMKWFFLSQFKAKKYNPILKISRI